jgi:hypothetical protein
MKKNIEYRIYIVRFTKFNLKKRRSFLYTTDMLGALLPHETPIVISAITAHAHLLPTAAAADNVWQEHFSS